MKTKIKPKVSETMWAIRATYHNLFAPAPVLGQLTPGGWMATFRTRIAANAYIKAHGWQDTNRAVKVRVTEV